MAPEEVAIENLICSSDEHETKQIMEHIVGTEIYKCPECGKRAVVTVTELTLP